MTIASLIIDIAANTSKLNTDTDAVNKKLDAMGGMASKLGKELAAAFTVGALVNFGRQVLDAGDRIQKMADQTGLATSEVQKLEYIAGQSGTSIGSLVGAVQNLQQRLGDDNSGAVGAIAKLGINMEAFNKLGTYDQMTTLGGAIRDIKDPTEQASVAAAIFGKTWKEILPAIKSGMEEVGAAAPKMSDETVKALDRIGDAMTDLKGRVVVWGAAVVVGIEGAGFALGDFLSKFNPSHFGVANSTLLKLQTQLADPSHGLLGALGAIKPPTVAFTAALGPLGMSAKEAAAQEKELTARVQASIPVNKAAEEATRRLTEANKNFRESVTSLTSSVIGARVGMGAYSNLMPDLSYRTAQFREKLEILDSSVNEFHDGITVAGDTMRTVTIPLFAALPNVIPQGTRAIEEATKATGTLADEIQGRFSAALGRIPGIFIDAFTGGGGVIGALKGIGVDLLNAIVGLLLQPMLDTVAKYVAAMINQFLGLSNMKVSMPSMGGGSAPSGVPTGDGSGGVGAEAMIPVVGMWYAAWKMDRDHMDALSGNIQQDIASVVDTALAAGWLPGDDGWVPGPNATEFTVNGQTIRPPAENRGHDGTWDNTYGASSWGGEEARRYDMADGGMGRATGPTMFYSAGNEDFAFSGEGKSFGGGGGDIVIHTHVMLDGKEVGKSVERANARDWQTRNMTRAA